uniref:RING-type domain-containing protein n=1 Tax=Electrophorus electricus TaxID=8005 RepID=A0AAY5F3C1_ELEEL
MLDEPVTSICGHTFCKKCLSHHLENTRACPLCKHSLLENPHYFLFLLSHMPLSLRCYDILCVVVTSMV